MRREKGLQSVAYPEQEKSFFLTVSAPLSFLKIFLNKIHVLAQNVVVGVRRFCENIAGHKYIDEALAVSEQRYREIVESISDGFFALDKNWRFTYINRRAAANVGFEPRELIGRNIWKKIPDILATLQEHYYRQVMTARTPSHFEIKGKMTEKSYSINVYPSGDGISVFWQDITARKKEETEREEAKKTLEESRKKYQALIETTSDFIWEMDCRGNYTYCSPQMKVLWGIEPATMIGKSPFDLMPPDVKKEAAEHFQHLIHAPGPFLNEITTAHIGQDALIYIESSGVPFFDEKGALLGFRGISRDITERKRAELVWKEDKETVDNLVKEQTRELLETQAELEQAKRLSDIGTLAATVAHEFRNPLAAVNIAAENIKRKSNGDNVAKYLNTIAKKVQESNQIINNLLFFSRLRPPHVENVDLSFVLKDCIDFLKRQTNDIIVKAQIEPIKNITVSVDPLQMREVFINILNNARDAVKEGEGLISIIADYDANNVMISFKDNGDGIAANAMPRVFDPFFTTKAKGTGLGLTVSRRIIEMHGGRIAIESGIGRGTTVSLTVPQEKGKRKYDPRTDLDHR
jgi:PAS domain S-box-containing protein